MTSMVVEDTHANQDPNIVDDFDLDIFLLSDIPAFDIDSVLHEPGPFESDDSPIVFQSSGSPSPVQSEGIDPPPLASASPDSVSSYVNYLEKFLMDDVDWSGAGEEMGEDIVADFFSGVGLADLSSPNSDGDNPVQYDALNTDCQSEKEKNIPLMVGLEEENEDFVSKKRRRQMRNRESAMISRERKKMYVKDLEIKSKHLYSECLRLEHALRCCMEENYGLRQNLQFHKDKPCVAFAAKQESAVLFAESLLLGSLFWLVSLAFFFLAPDLQNLEPDRKAASRWGRDVAMAVVAGIVSTVTVRFGRDVKLSLLGLGRRCRGMREKMKFFSSSSLYPLLA